MYPSSTRSTTSLPPLSLHFGNLPGFEFSADRETPISNPPSSIFSAPSTTSTSLSSTQISPLSLLSGTPSNKSTPLCQRQRPLAVVRPFQRSATFPLAQPPSVPRPVPISTPSLPEGFQKCSFVDSLVDTGALIIETIWPNQTIPILNAKVLPLRVFIQETIRRSRTSFSTLQLALYYLLRIKTAVLDFEINNPEWFNGPCNFGKTASKHPIACGRRMFLAAVIVASKYLQDRNYSNRAWAKISGLPVKEINANEYVFLNVAKYNLYVGEALYKRWSSLLLNHVMAAVQVTTQQAVLQHGLTTPPLTPIISPSHSSPLHHSNLRNALARRFCEHVKSLSPELTESELISNHVLGFTPSPNQQSQSLSTMSPPPSRSGIPTPQYHSRVSAPLERQFTSTPPPFPCNPLLTSHYTVTLPSPPSSTSSAQSDSSSSSGSDSEYDEWSPKSSISSASSTSSSPTNTISPCTNIRRKYLKSLSCSATQTQGLSCFRRSSIGSPDLSGTIDPKLLSLNSSALTAVKGLCSLAERPMVFEQSRSRYASTVAECVIAHGEKRLFGSMGEVAMEPSKRRRGAICETSIRYA